MPFLFVIGHLKTNGDSARQKVIDALATTSKYSAANEPGTYKYCIAIPREGDEKSVFAIEEYADQEAMDAHMDSPAVQEMIKIFGSDASLIAAEPAIYGLPCTLSPSVEFTRPSIENAADPVIVFANLEYKPGQASQAIPGWAELVEFAREEEDGTLSYAVLVDDEKGWVRTVEAYSSLEFLDGVHVKSSAVRKNQRQNRDMRTGGKEVYRLKMVAGYLSKSSTSQSKI